MKESLANITAIARAEFLTGARNRWIILAALILLTFASVLAFVGGAPGGAQHVGRLTVTLANLAVLSVYLTPLLALMLSFDAIAGEIDRGALALLLAAPVSRDAVLLGKFSGQFAVLAISLLIGFGAPGMVLYFLAPDADALLALIRLVGTSVMLGAAFLAIGYAISCAARTSQTAAGLAVGAWLLLVVLYDLALLGALVADNGGEFSRVTFPWLLIVNPADAFRIFNLSALHLGGETTGLGGAGEMLPFSTDIAVAVLAAWVGLALSIAAILLRRIKP